MILTLCEPACVLIPLVFSTYIHLSVAKLFSFICCHSFLYSMNSIKTTSTRVKYSTTANTEPKFRFVTVRVLMLLCSSGFFWVFFPSVHTLRYALLPVNHLIPTGRNGSLCKHVHLTHSCLLIWDTGVSWDIHEF